MNRRRWRSLAALFALAAGAGAACGEDDTSGPAGGGQGGSSASQAGAGGVAGATGASGDAGASGNAGAFGNAGASGNTGASGKTGASGNIGVAGNAGRAGAGAAGDAGMGGAGASGHAGAGGGAGAAGHAGAAGSAGGAGQGGVCTGGACPAGSAGAAGSSGASFEPGEDRPGGAVTTDRRDELAFSQPAPNLSFERHGLFQTGRALFEVPWIAAPGTITDRDGLGPLFIAPSCPACHVRNGSGAPPEPAQPAVALLVRLSVPLAAGGQGPEPTYGDQIQPSGVSGVPGEARVTLLYDEIAGAFADGEAYSLRRPQFFIENTNYGPLAEGVLTSPRLAQALPGLGLLGAVDEGEIAQGADPDDGDGDGISGRVNRLPLGPGFATGRFGWKANQIDLRSQNAGALAGDLGITSPAQLAQPCTAAQAACLAAPSGGSPELEGSRLDALTFYTATLAVPARPSAHDPEVLAGKALFRGVGCAACHRPSWVTGAPEGLPELAGQLIWPYTDLLLHDLGEGLADGRPDHEASGVEWRTPPLWGVGLSETVSGGTHLLHDGRARSIAEAVLWHGGEAEASREAFRALGAADRQLLLLFVASL